MQSRPYLADRVLPAVNILHRLSLCHERVCLLTNMSLDLDFFGLDWCYWVVIEDFRLLQTHVERAVYVEMDHACP